MSRLATLIDIHDGNAWQSIAEILFQLKYGSERIQRIPDQHQGDWGLEAYTVDGLAFQCYAPEKEYPVDEIYLNQRNKITTDIRKFKENANELGALIRPQKYSRWFLITPRHDSKKLNLHAAKKSEEIRAACNHVTSDFQIMIHSGDEFFFEEIGRYISQGVQALRVEIPKVSEAQLDQHLTQHSSGFTVIQEKLKRGGVKSAAVLTLSKEYIRDFVQGQSVKDTILKSSPELFNTVDEKIQSIERDILKKYQLSQSLTPEQLEHDLQKLKADLIEQSGKTLDSKTVDYLARGTIADWLIRCPMDF